jgi:hypothetical protein
MRHYIASKRRDPLLILHSPVEQVRRSLRHLGTIVGRTGFRCLHQSVLLLAIKRQTRHTAVVIYLISLHLCYNHFCTCWIFRVPVTEMWSNCSDSAKSETVYNKYKCLKQRSTNPGCQVAVATNFCTVVPNICGSPLWNLLHVTPLEHRVLKRLQEVWCSCDRAS